MSDLPKETEARLYRNLIRLGDMMGDGLHLEPDGKWISREYSQTLKALGIHVPRKPRQNNSARINERMAVRVKETVCSQCGGTLKQTRSGAKRAICLGCGTKWILLK